MKLFSRVAAMLELYHDRQWRAKGKVTPEVHSLTGVTRWPLADQPADMLGAISVDSPTVHSRDFSALPALG